MGLFPVFYFLRLNSCIKLPIFRLFQIVARAMAHAGDHLDRMALISRLLLEPRILALRTENEALKLKLFWKEHNKSDLETLMTACNQNGIQCNCLSCAISGRMDEEQTALPRGAVCRFKQWFEEQLAKHGLSSKCGVDEDQEDVGPHISCDDGNGVFDVDSHFHHLVRDDWYVWMYGAKLWKAKSVTDPEAVKLQALFYTLSRSAEGSHIVMSS
jgi:hypothetical protein